MVLTIAQMTKKSNKGFRRYNSSTLEFTLGNYRIWLKGYVAYMGKDRIRLTEHGDDSVMLECPALTGLGSVYTEFKKKPVFNNKYGIQIVVGGTVL